MFRELELTASSFSLTVVKQRLPWPLIAVGLGVKFVGMAGTANFRETDDRQMPINRHRSVEVHLT